MIHLLNLDWTTGSGKQIRFEEVIKLLKDATLSDGNIYIGTDSSISKGHVNFATAICIHGNGTPSRYFFFKNKQPKNKFNSLVHRITEEVHRSVSVADILINKYKIKNSNIELHLDVSPFEVNTKTSKFSDSLRGYVQGAGFTCKIKPDAWASQTVADKHSK